MPTEFGWHLGGTACLQVKRVRVTMGRACMRIVAAAATAAVLILSANPGLAQSTDPKAGSQRQQQGTEAEGPKKIDEFAEAAKHLPGPAGNPECVSLGRKAVILLFRDDLDTAFRHMELYDRFGCPSGHIQAAFRCFLLSDKAAQGAAEKAQGSSDKTQDAKAQDVLARSHACWINPTPDTPPPSAAAPSPTTNR